MPTTSTGDRSKTQRATQNQNQQNTPVCEVCGAEKVKKRYWFCPNKC